ncbi:MAG: hypothetical protein U0234_13725 [Sandaracinus sp.]
MESRGSRSGEAPARPLKVRPGARYACAGDGLCCTDVHLLGPVAKAERAPIEALRPGAIVRGRTLAVLAPGTGGGCTFLASDRRCEIHTTGIKPRSCARYPFLLAATPAGGRIGTDHRCPCRTMGERPALTVEAALPSLLDRRGRLSVDRRVDGRIPLERRRHVSFARYEAIEAERLARLAQEGLPPGDALAFDVHALARSLDRVAEAPTRWGAMHAAFARALEAIARRGTPAPFARPWAESFAAAARRATSPGDPEAMLADWAADVIWSLEWTFSTTLEGAERELRWRGDLARVLARAIPARADAAMAEAIAIVEVVGLGDEWLDAAAAP